MSDTRDTDETAALPEWLTPGAEVVVIAANTPSPVLTITKVMKRDVVLSNGDRWSRTRLAPNATHFTKSRGSVWEGYDALFPADAPQVHQARQATAEQGVTMKCRVIASKVTDAIQRGDWDEARRHELRLGEWLANAPKPPPSASRPVGDDQHGK